MHPFTTSSVFVLGLSFVLAAGCGTSDAGATLDASPDAVFPFDGAVVNTDATDDAAPSEDAAVVDGETTDDAASDDAAPDDASLDDASVVDGAMADAGVGTLCGDVWIDLESDVHHCGACEDDCTLREGVDASGVSCASGVCMLACDRGRGDCNGDPEDGCEATLDTPERCGACDVACSDATPVCDTTSASAACVSGCAPSQTRCGDACVDLGSSASDCSACGNVCPSAAHASAVCVDGACALACDSGYHDCSGACVDDADVASCGSACAPCANDPHGVTGCELGQCTLACAPGYAPVGGHCANIDECALTSGIGGAGAIDCDDTDGGYTCLCGAGYVSIGSGCMDIDECAIAAPVCGVHGTGGSSGRGCTNVAGTYACSCAFGTFAPSTGGSCKTTCGDGFQGPGEMCDDGGLVSNDGCSSTCTLELFSGWVCAGTAPTRCVIDWTFEGSSEGFTGANVSGSGYFTWNTPSPGAWNGMAPASSSEWLLMSPLRVAPPGTTRAVVTLSYGLSFQNGFDGGFVEASVDGGPFTFLDVVAGDAYFVLSSAASGNPLGPRAVVFTGQYPDESSTFRVPVTAGHAFRIRFHAGSDNSGNTQPPNPAWTIRNVSVTFER